MKLVGVWFFFELALFAFLSDHYGFLKILGLYLFPTFLAFIFAPWLIRPNLLGSIRPGMALPPIHRPLGFFALLIPSAASRALAILVLLPGVRTIFFYFIGKKLIKFLEGKINIYSGGMSGGDARFGGAGFDFRTYQAGQTWRPREEKDVTPVEPISLDVPVERISSTSSEIDRKKTE